jgi:hypothetical protein
MTEQLLCGNSLSQWGIPIGVVFIELIAIPSSLFNI